MRNTVRKRMDALGWSIKRTAEEAGITRANLSRFLAGKADLTVASLDRLTRALGLKFEIRERK